MCTSFACGNLALPRPGCVPTQHAFAGSNRELKCSPTYPCCTECSSANTPQPSREGTHGSRTCNCKKQMQVYKCFQVVCTTCATFQVTTCTHVVACVGGIWQQKVSKHCCKALICACARPPAVGQFKSLVERCEGEEGMKRGVVAALGMTEQGGETRETFLTIGAQWQCPLAACLDWFWPQSRLVLGCRQRLQVWRGRVLDGTGSPYEVH